MFVAPFIICLEGYTIDTYDDRIYIYLIVSMSMQHGTGIGMGFLRDPWQKRTDITKFLDSNSHLEKEIKLKS